MKRLVAIVALPLFLLGCALAWGGLVLPPLRRLYDYAWFVGFFAAGISYLLLARGRNDHRTSEASRA